jgi:hypothetical protein
MFDEYKTELFLGNNANAWERLFQYDEDLRLMYDDEETALVDDDLCRWTCGKTAQE